MMCRADIEIPCSIGDEVYAIGNNFGRKRVRKGKVYEMFFIEGMKLCIAVRGVARGEWGKTVFPTFEEAQKHLEGDTRED